MKKIVFIYIICLCCSIPGITSNTEFSDKTIKIPFSYVQSFIILDVQLEKFLPLKLIFDTGAEHTILFEKRWTDLITQSYVRDIKVIGSDLQKELPAHLTQSLLLSFGKVHEVMSPLIVLKDNSTNISQLIGETVHGIISASVFNNYIIEIDYRRKFILLHQRPHIIPENYNKLDLQIYKNKPYLMTQIRSKGNEVLNVNLLLDTGASLPLLLYSDSSSMIPYPENIIPGYLGSGLGGVLTGFVGKIQAVSFDTFLIPSVITHFLKVGQRMRFETLQKNGLIGNQILDKFNMFIDYQDEKLYLKARKNYKRILEFDRSGLLVVSGGAELQKFYVAHIIPDSPASEAGLKEQDEILSINSFPIEFFTLSGIHKKLQSRVGKHIRLSIRRNGEKMKFTFLLRDLI